MHIQAACTWCAPLVRRLCAAFRVQPELFLLFCARIATTAVWARHPAVCRHDYCGVKQDLEAYWPKLKSGAQAAPTAWPAHLLRGGR